MGRLHPAAKDVGASPEGGGGLAFSIGTLVTDPHHYAGMVESFREKGFAGGDCEFIHIDNTSGNTFDAYGGLNRLLNSARGAHVILCHQDVRLHADDRAILERKLAELERIDPNWAVVGNAGGVAPGHLAIRISDPHGEDQNLGPFPAPVGALDENFLLVKAAARMSFSRNLTGFHFYGTDICLNADILGYTAYVIDFHLRHLSGGKIDGAFLKAKAEFEQKWSRALRRRKIQTTCAALTLKGTFE